MNYRHAYHAGNFADVMKHASLALIINYLKLKEKPFLILDTHAGTGSTDLSGTEAQKTGEYKDGIARILAADKPHDLLIPYLETLAQLGCEGPEPKLYPGSPLIAATLARPQDRLAFCELHPEDYATLRARFRRDERVKAYEMDGYGALKSMLPPKERRGLILIDPPFEQRSEFERILQEIEHIHARFATGTVMIWYPIKDPSVSGAFVEHLEHRGPEKTLRAELFIRASDDPTRMSGCGLIIINPPFTLHDQLTDLFGWLKDILAQGTGAERKGAAARVEWVRK